LKDLLSLELTELFEFINTINSSKVSEIIFKIKKDLKSLIDLGLGYLTLNRGIATLSNGESQKVKLAKSLNNSLNELIYILDEPSIGFHSRDVNKIVNSIRNIVSNNNTAIVVEHNREIINRSDNIIDIGPKSGENGGEIVFAGKREDILNCSNSITGHYLNNKKRILSYHKPIDAFYHVKNININNIHNLDVKIPSNMLICITGVSGSGKSSLLKYLIDNDKSIIKIGKENISASSRSNVATYTNIFDFIRVLFAKSNSVDAGQFSFNSVGACSNCGGAGHVKYDMHFLGDVIQVCEVCNGKRYNQLVLNYKFKGKNIAEVLEMTIDEAITFFDDDEIISRLLILKEVGLEYLKLGQTLDTLSGGEIQRINLAKNLVKKGNIYVFDEPTQGLHLKDIEKILDIIKNIVNKGNTVICIEHNLDFILSCDYIVDMGPDAGKNGGKVVFQGYVDEILNCNSFTAQAIKNYLSE
jgi:excinuclease UvrABC ATPase subunit